MHALGQGMGWNRVTRTWTPSRYMVKSLDSIGKGAEQPKTESGGIDESQATGHDSLVAWAGRWRFLSHPVFGSTQLHSRYRFGATRLWRGSSALGPGPRWVCRGSSHLPDLDTLGNPFRMRTPQEMLKEGVDLCWSFPRREPGIGPG